MAAGALSVWTCTGVGTAVSSEEVDRRQARRSRGFYSGVARLRQPESGARSPRRARRAPRRSTPRAAARRATVSATHAGSLRLPRCGTGARYGASDSTSRRSSGTRRSSASSVHFLNVTMPLNDTYHPTSSARLGERVRCRCSSGARRRTPRAPRFDDHRARVVFGLARVHDDRAVAARAASASCAAKARALPVARRVIVVIVEPALADRDGAASTSSRDARRCRARRRTSRASCGCTPAVKQTKPGCARRSPRARAAAASDSPMQTMRRRAGVARALDRRRRGRRRTRGRRDGRGCR